MSQGLSVTSVFYRLSFFFLFYLFLFRKVEFSREVSVMVLSLLTQFLFFDYKYWLLPLVSCCVLVNFGSWILLLCLSCVTPFLSSQSLCSCISCVFLVSTPVLCFLF